MNALEQIDEGRNYFGFTLIQYREKGSGALACSAELNGMHGFQGAIRRLR